MHEINIKSVTIWMICLGVLLFLWGCESASKATVESKSTPTEPKTTERASETPVDSNSPPVVEAHTETGSPETQNSETITSNPTPSEEVAETNSSDVASEPTEPNPPETQNSETTTSNPTPSEEVAETSSPNVANEPTEPNPSETQNSETTTSNPTPSEEIAETNSPNVASESTEPNPPEMQSPAASVSGQIPNEQAAEISSDTISSRSPLQNVTEETTQSSPQNTTAEPVQLTDSLSISPSGGNIKTGLGMMDDTEKRLKAIRDLHIKQEGDVIKIRLPGGILFNTNSYTVKQSARSTLRRVAEVLLDFPRLKVKVVGYTDNRGPENYNYYLSEQRAKEVARILDLPRNIIVIGRGPERPIGDNDTEAGRSKNRRVELELY